MADMKPIEQNDGAEYAIVREANWDFTLEKFAKGEAVSGGFPTRFEAIEDWLHFLKKEREQLDAAIARANEIRVVELENSHGH
ncbi:MAG: hypothetical protein AAAB19_29820 [Rhizobium sp.]